MTTHVGFIEVDGLGQNVPCVGRVTRTHTVAMLALTRPDLEAIAIGTAPTRKCQDLAREVIAYLGDPS
jgi:hypothetical protein